MAYSAAAGLEGTEAATLYANYKPALTISDEQLSTMLDRDHPAERYMREAKVMQIFEGTNQIQRMVIGRHLTSGAVPPAG